METNFDESQRFAKEISFILESIDRSQLKTIVIQSFKKSLEAILISKKNTIRNTGKVILKIGKNTGKFVGSEIGNMRYDFEDYVENIIPRVKYSFKTFKNEVIHTSNNKVKEFLELPEKDKKDLLVSGSLWIGSVLMTGGETDFEGGMPDLDTKLGGIGKHRNLFSHTILIGLSLEFFIRFAINLMRYGKNYLPQDRSKVWIIIDKLINQLDKNENILISGAWIGLSIHLLKDASIGSSKVKPYVGISKPLSMKTHQNIFLGNSFLSFILGKENIQRT